MIVGFDLEKLKQVLEGIHKKETAKDKLRYFHVLIIFEDWIADIKNMANKLPAFVKSF